MQNNGEGSEVAESGVLKSAGGTDIIPSRATGEYSSIMGGCT